MRCLAFLQFSLFALISVASAQSQRVALPEHLASIHPRVAAHSGNSRAEMRAFVEKEAHAKAILEKSKAELAPYLAYVRNDPNWMASRLQMYWKSHATDVYNRGDAFDHASGHAPVATVRYPGSRNPTTVYKAPRLEDIPPYEDDTRGVLLVNSSLPDRPLEWASPSKTGRIIDGINSNILRMAQNAAQIAWISGDEEYARFAFSIFDTYMRGMACRNEPIDITHGHSQTIYGMSTFEVIQEGVLETLATTYDFLYDYAGVNHADALPVYADVFRRWVAVTLHNGVPFNNWDLIEARFVVDVALVLEDDAAYADHRGAQYYLNQVLNEDATRQWSLRKLAARGFDPQTGIWFESPGYSMMVVNQFISLINLIDSATGTDLLTDLPVVGTAARSMAQYAFPNGVTVSWGDSHYGPFSTEAAHQMVVNAQMHHRRKQEEFFTGMIGRFNQMNRETSGAASYASHNQARDLDALFHREAIVLDPAIAPLPVDKLLSATFSAPSVSYFAQRNGLDATAGLMIAEAGSLGNHQHANGITMELYGLGLPLAPDSGIGTNYFEADHGEYYSQFPAHNTVVVDGVSSYPTMKSHHGFTVEHAFPNSGDQQGIQLPVTFSDVSFLEPETNADQRRMMSIVRTSPTSGYYVDIFRSHRRDGQDLKHDYFLHGLGQRLDITANDDSPLAKSSTEKLTFADEELNAYDYLWEKQKVATAAAYQATYHLQIPNKLETQLQVWIAGGSDRELFSVLAPAARSLRDTVPAEVGALPLHTLVVRQNGEAWNRPFVSILQPANSEHPVSIRSVVPIEVSGAPVGSVFLQISNRDGSQQRIFNTTVSAGPLHVGDSIFDGTYAVASVSEEGCFMFIGDGRTLSLNGMQLTLQKNGSAFVARKGSVFTLQLTHPGELMLPGTEHGVLRASGRVYIGKQVVVSGRTMTVYELPAMALATMELRQP